MKVAAESTRSGLRIPDNTAELSNTQMAASSSQPAAQLGNITIDTNLAHTHIIQSTDQSKTEVPGVTKRTTLLSQIHDFGHLGANAMVKAIHQKALE